MSKLDVIGRVGLLEEVERIYHDHYEQAYDQAIHDFFNAVRKRIRGSARVSVVPTAQYDELKDRHKKLLETANIIDAALREYQKKYGELDDSKHGTWVEVDDGVLIGTGTHLECSECGTWVSKYQKSCYCAHCGAKME
jgi:hypothetical protein